MGEPVTIKGTRQGLVILYDSNADFEEIKDSLHRKMASAKGFFKGAKFSLHNEKNLLENQKNELENICIQYGLVLSEEQVVLPRGNKTVPTNDNMPQHTKKSSSPPGDQKTLLIKRTLRSGQSIQYDGHVVVMGDVHAGAEIIATGYILVIGRCSGVVHAGVSGDLNAQVIAGKLCPTQLRIGSAIVTSPEEEPQYPEVAKLKNGQIIVERIKG
ncbi:septum site-determining protein MinC [Desulfofalx alkaliphila]|uniref:septum site-determining protein MinC n=1 Tax=Desulfofalx alkaliphila TaxID=105483 RepID=UPI0004E14FB9|nr:septum site-determining protein MinC [Desulfofalx alkaliphila]